ncbi:MAG: response regulator transcription factor [Bacteroidales bacterium]|jgi:DNA-binding NarL/FixJ family response regulator|nr:response regulator transcription factor [Bacteroidales bacterium]
MKLNLFLVDDHSLFREGLKFLLSNFDFIENIYEAENGMQFISALKNNTPVDIALLDIEMPVMNGIEATRQALLIRPELKIIALSMYSEESYYSSMIDAGAVGFLMKNSNFSEVKKAISDVWEGKNYFSSEILQSILTRVMHKKQQNVNDEITERETEILFYICKGLSNAEIARELTISKRTVDKHRENLLEKTTSKNTANLVIFAIKNGYFSI